MSRKNKQFDNEHEFHLSEKFAEDIKKLFKAPASVPPEVDKAILEKASQKLVLSRKHFHILRWIGPAAAAAAVIMFALLFTNSHTKQVSMLEVTGTSSDFDRNGRVDILDAFKLAKQIQSVSKPDEKWDINGDGRVDNGDVETIAYAAVSLNKGV